MTIMPPIGNRTPVAAQTFTDITISLEDGGPDRWASGDLGTNFSDPDDDQLNYSVGSSNESVAGAVISEPGPIVIVQAQGGGAATITITARDPGGLTATQSFRVTVNDRPDHSNTPAGATTIALSESFQGQIDSPNDVDYFRLRVDVPGTLTIRTTGNADPDIAVFDGAGNEVPGVSGSWIGSITQDILDRGHDLLVRFSGGNAGGGYTGNTTLDQRSQTSPDLSVGSPTVSDSGPETGGAFTLSATVTNTGDGASAATTLRYYRSTDASITTSDTSVGTDAVGSLAAAGTISESVDLTAPSTAGTYYYGACVDAVTGESDTTNNCSSSIAVTVAEPQTSPDLSVGSPTVSDSDPETGGAFSLSATVSNDGDGAAAATTLRYYRSTDASITTSDTSVGTDAVGALAAAGTSSESISLTALSTAGTYYYGACVDAVTGESDTTNNCSGSVTVTVTEPAPQPDLVVGSASADDSNLNTGDSFTLSATVSNAGDEQSAASTLRYYRSTDSTISSSDTQIGSDAVGALAASGTSAESISLTAPSTAGTYYYGACVDAVTDESDTTNNCSSSVTIAVEEESTGQPDLRIVGVVAGTPIDGVSPGTRIQFSANVRNYGDANSDATTLRYYRSTDATISVSDTEVGTDEVFALVPSRQVSEGIDLTAPSPAGTYYYGACVDAVTGESDTTNNCSGSLAVTVSEHEPDLVVGSPTVNDNSPASGASFSLSTTVRNAGSAASSSTTLRYYRSTDATITTSDTSVGTDAVGTLAAAGTISESVELTAPSPAGTYYYGACVDAVTDESDTTNNCSSSVTVTVAEPQTSPDLSVGSPTVSDSGPETGGAFTLSATVTNTGDGASAATTLRYYRSTDASITTSDTSVGTDAVGSLAAAGTISESVDLTAPSTAGTYYYGACVDAVTGESDTTNNCSSSIAVTVAEPQTSPDLSVGSPTVSDSDPETGGAFSLSATVSNDGDGAAAATTLRYYRSTDASITTSDTSVGTDAVGALAAAGTSSESISLTALSTAGTYYYGACVDAVTGESDTTNNCSGSVTVTVTEPAPQPDLVVGSASADDSNLNTGDSFTLSATVSNAGDEQSAASTLRYYRSTDSTISSSDTQIGSDAVGALAASGTSAESISLTAPSTAGTYYYGACVDAVTDESDTTNNCSSSVTIAVEEESTGQPDLRIVGVVAGTPIDGVSPGTRIQFSANVRNYGDANSDATTLRYYRSTDATISVSDTEVGTDEVFALVPSRQVSEGIDLTAPSPAGTYYYGACVDAVTGESDTTNNCSGSLAVTVSEHEPDLVVGSPTVNDNSPASGASFSLSTTVRNAGSAASSSTTLRYYRSTDATITTSDTSVGTDAVGTLAAAGTISESVELTAPSPAGTYYYGACVDAVTDESDTTNNCSSSVTVTVAEPQTSPDLSVGSPTVSDSGPETGGAFTLSATVTNTGDGASAATTLRYYRSTDASITTSDTSVGTDAVGSLAAAGTISESVDLTAPSTAGTYYYGACVDAVTGESDTTNNCSSSIAVTVAEPQTSPDLSVGSPTVSDSDPETGGAFSLSATVSNDGDGAAAATTLRYYRSTDASITTSDTSVGTDAVGALAAAGTSSESISLTALSTAGTYYYGACVDAVTGESDTTNNCSGSVTVTVTEPAPQPDLVVGSASADDSNLNTGDSFTLSATVSNAGDEQSAASTLRYYRSTDSTISSSDTQIGSDAVGALAASGTSAESISLTAPSTAGTYYYGACVDAVTDESDTTNNCSSSVTIAVEEESTGQPDLRIVGVVAGTPIDGVSPGTRIQFSANVRNYGDANSDATTLRYYRSTDATISVSDTEVGTDEVFALVPSRQVSEGIDLTAPSPAGTYYYGACVDAVTGESDTTNNCSGSLAVTVSEHEPDLVVGSPTVNDNSPASGASFSLSTTVRNAGSAASSSTTLRYYRSTDATITTSDTSVGTDAVGTLAAAGTISESVELTAPSPAGTYYYGACVDAVTDESDTTNNCSSSVTVTVAEPQTSPDLSVGSPTVSDSGPETGGAFTLSATVTNTGDGASAATTLRYYRSTDASITTSDTSVGTDAVGSLAAAGTISESVDLTAPSTAGTYYYGACVDAVTGESDTTNNCSSSIAVTVAEPQTSPDLSVGSPTVSDSDPETGGAFSLSATVSNDGDGAAAATTLRYYRSTDASITTSDTSVGTDAVGALAAAGTSSESISLTALSTAGTYYYGACVDAVTGESDTTNNCSGSVRVDVQEPAAHPDLTVTLSITPPAGGIFHVGSSFGFGATVINSGGAASPATTLRYYRSTDTTISSSDTEVGTDAVEGLDAHTTSSESISLTSPSTPGTYYYNACVDAVAGESNTTNNCSFVSIGVTVIPEADLVVGSPSVTDNTPETGGAFTLSATASNTGDGASAATMLRYYRSTDATISSSDTEVGTDAVGRLAASGTSAESILLTAPASAGTYYFGACVDAVSGESSTTNNCSSSVTVTVTEPESQPDLIVDSFTITLGPTLETSPGALVKLNQRVANVGDAASAATTVRYYRSTDATITTSDTQVSTDAVPELTASSRSVEAENERLPTAPGTYYYGACVDAVAGESNTANNCSRSVKVTVPAPQPDLVVGSASADDSNLNTGDSFTLSATVSNAGDEQSAASTLRYYRSTDSTISSSDTQIGSDAVGALAASGTSAESISLTAPSTAGTYYYGACVDAVTDESDTTNNCSSSVTIAVEEESTGQPDLRIVGVVAGTPIDGVSPGTRIQFSANVRNYGDANSDATTLRYYRSTDATITTSDTEVGTDEVSALVPSAQVSEGIDLNAPSNPGTYYYGACVDAVTGESDTTNNCSGALEIDVN